MRKKGNRESDLASDALVLRGGPSTYHPVHSLLQAQDLSRTSLRRQQLSQVTRSDSAGHLRNLSNPVINKCKISLTISLRPNSQRKQQRTARSNSEPSG